VTTGVPLVSVVMPTNRGGPWTQEALRSALAQSMDDLEVIVVDDGVPGGLAHLEQLDTRVRVLRSLGRGVAMARNTGIAAARGRYVATLDPDDVWLPPKLEQQLVRLEGEPEVAMCHCQFEFIDAAGTVTGPGWAGPVGRDALSTGMFPVAFPTTVWRRDVLELVGCYHPVAFPAADLDLLLKVVPRWPVVFEPTTLVQYRWHGANVSAQLTRQYEAASRSLRFRIAASVARGEMAPTSRARAPLALRRVRRSYVRSASDEILTDVRAGRVADAARKALWATRVDPVATMAVLGERSLGYLGRRAHRIREAAPAWSEPAQP